MTLGEIREQIDRTDRQMKELFARRMMLAEQVAQVKAQTDDDIFKPERERQIIERQSADMPPEVLMEYRAFLRRIMEVSRKYQYGRMLQMKDCFPYAFTCGESPSGPCAFCGKDMTAADAGALFPAMTPAAEACDYRELGRMIAGEEAVSAGVGIMEEIGAGVNDELNAMLVREHLFINRCTVTQERPEGAKYKAVVFSRELCVRPEDNRLKLSFVVPNRSGALGSILMMIADYGVNLTEIHSIPFRDGNDWNYRFFAELNLNLLHENAQALIYQLSCETNKLQLLGSYLCEGDFVS